MKIGSRKESSRSDYHFEQKEIRNENVQHHISSTDGPSESNNKTPADDTVSSFADRPSEDFKARQGLTQGSNSVPQLSPENAVTSLALIPSDSRGNQAIEPTPSSTSGGEEFFPDLQGYESTYILGHQTIGKALRRSARLMKAKLEEQSSFGAHYLVRNTNTDSALTRTERFIRPTLVVDEHDSVSRVSKPRPFPERRTPATVSRFRIGSTAGAAVSPFSDSDYSLSKSAVTKKRISINASLKSQRLSRRHGKPPFVSLLSIPRDPGKKEGVRLFDFDSTFGPHTMSNKDSGVSDLSLLCGDSQKRSGNESEESISAIQTYELSELEGINRWKGSGMLDKRVQGSALQKVKMSMRHLLDEDEVENALINIHEGTSNNGENYTSTSVLSRHILSIETAQTDNQDLACVYLQAKPSTKTLMCAQSKEEMTSVCEALSLALSDADSENSSMKDACVAASEDIRMRRIAAMQGLSNSKLNSSVRLISKSVSSFNLTTANLKDADSSRAEARSPRPRSKSVEISSTKPADPAQSHSSSESSAFRTGAVVQEDVGPAFAIRCFSSALRKGPRREMQDLYIVKPWFEDHGSSVGFFGVMDGHGGSGYEAAECAAQVLRRSAKISIDASSSDMCQDVANPSKEISDEFSEKTSSAAAGEKEERGNDSAIGLPPVGALATDPSSSFAKGDQKVRAHFKLTFAEANIKCSQLLRANRSDSQKGRLIATKNIQGMPEVGPARGGTTAVCVRIETEKRRLWASHVGDSRAIICRRGAVVPLTWDHTPKRADECVRIARAGGAVFSVGGNLRVNGELALTRSLGDVHFEGIVSSVPEVCAAVFEEGDVLIIASDGLWSVFVPSEVASFVQRVRESCNHGWSQCDCIRKRLDTKTWDSILSCERETSCGTIGETRGIDISSSNSRGCASSSRSRDSKPQQVPAVTRDSSTKTSSIHSLTPSGGKRSKSVCEALAAESAAWLEASAASAPPICTRSVNAPESENAESSNSQVSKWRRSSPSVNWVSSAHVKEISPCDSDSIAVRGGSASGFATALARPSLRSHLQIEGENSIEISRPGALQSACSKNQVIKEEPLKSSQLAMLNLKFSAAQNAQSSIFQFNDRVPASVEPTKGSGAGTGEKCPLECSCVLGLAERISNESLARGSRDNVAVLAVDLDFYIQRE